MSLPSWYIDSVEDYLSIIRNFHLYSLSELHDASKTQRDAEYKLFCERRGGNTQETLNPPPKQRENLPKLIPYGTADLYRGYSNGYSNRNDKIPNKRVSKNSFWDVLKTTNGHC